MSTLRDDFRKKVSKLDDDFIDTMTTIGDRIQNVIDMVNAGERKEDILGELEDLLDEVR